MNVQRIAVARVGIDDDRNLDARADPPRPIGDLGLREQAHIGLADVRGGDGVAGNERHGEADLLGQLGRERVEHADESQRAGRFKDAVDA